MADFLIAHLKSKGLEHSALATLMNQWGFDEQLIPKALQNVGNVFPHYSRHDESHCRQILMNIERLLGDNIRLLTATDTWLILEAAYWHDIGMVVPQQDIIDACDEDDFKTYLQSIRQAQHHELNRFALSFDHTDLARCFAGADTPFDAVEKFRFLMAEWFRQKHPARAKSAVQTPSALLGITSPRTELIPNRLFRILASICHMHGAPFVKVISELPFKEAGLAREDCHPRYVACLLRIGDLLDLDDNRFCPVMQRIAGGTRPELSRSHEDKHAALRHFRLDRDSIEISAECESIGGYIETFKWFDWIKTEIQNQVSIWQQIVPTRELGLLPTLGKVSVSLSGKFQILSPGERPQFVLDVEQATRLLQGSNLYKTKFSCIRELLQNAVDASLIRLWLEMGTSDRAGDLKSPTTVEVDEALSRYPITVDIRESADCKVKNGFSEWTVTITDRGCGISRDDLKHMLQIGGSERNLVRHALINNMPEWMKPSGIFGIGFQSIFMITSEVSIITKSVHSNEALRINMSSPTGKSEGLVLVETLKNDIQQPFGTTISFSALTELYPNRYSRNFMDKSSIAEAIITSLDPQLDSAFPVEAAQLADQVGLFGGQSLVPVEGKMSCVSPPKVFEIGANRGSLANRALDRMTYVEVEGQPLFISFKPILAPSHTACSFFYRGQPFQTNFAILYGTVNIDLLSGKAEKWVTISRDNVASDAEDSLYELMLQAIKQKIEVDLNQTDAALAIPRGELPYYSLFAEQMVYQAGPTWKGLAERLRGAWMDLHFAKPSDLSFRKFLEGDGATLTGPVTGGVPVDTGSDFVPSGSHNDIRLALLVREWAASESGYVCAVATLKSDTPGAVAYPSPIQGQDLTTFRDDYFRERYFFTRTRQPLYTPRALAANLAAKIGFGGQNTRYILAVEDDWQEIRIKNTIQMRAGLLFPYHASSTKLILLPFLFLGFSRAVQMKPSQLDELSAWLVDRVVSELDQVAIKAAYVRLIKYIDEDVMASSPHAQTWSQARSIEA